MIERVGCAGCGPGAPDAQGDRIHPDHRLTGTDRDRDLDRPGLAQALAAVCAGDTLVVAEPGWLARSPSDARDIVDSLTGRGGKVSPAGGR
ncbi:recombinase family protein [Streptomyces geranii]|uniref:recombinase family protein n=1 Tax=Streptomyces geranii TaxID=2058923 RepID=UPI000D02FE4F|nr:recombinase family protein [Streptomyces geranii]